MTTVIYKARIGRRLLKIVKVESRYFPNTQYAYSVTGAGWRKGCLSVDKLGDVITWARRAVVEDMPRAKWHVEFDYTAKEQH
jgi:hypothetical protein